jgi:hypothetical protein
MAHETHGSAHEQETSWLSWLMAHGSWLLGSWPAHGSWPHGS